MKDTELHPFIVVNQEGKLEMIKSEIERINNVKFLPFSRLIIKGHDDEDHYHVSVEKQLNQ